MYELVILGSIAVAVAYNLVKVVYDSFTYENERQIQYLNSNAGPCYEAGLFVSSGLNIGENIITQQFRNYASNMFENTTTANINHEETRSGSRNLRETERVSGTIKNVTVPASNSVQAKSSRNEPSTSKVSTKAALSRLVVGEMGESSVTVERNISCLTARNITNQETTSSGETAISTNPGVLDCKSNSDHKMNVATVSSGADQHTTVKHVLPLTIPTRNFRQATSVESCYNSTHSIKPATDSRNHEVIIGRNDSSLETSQKTVMVKGKKLNSNRTNVNTCNQDRNDPVSTSHLENNSLSNLSILNRNIWADSQELSDMCKIPNISENIDVDSEEKCLFKNTDIEIKILNTMYVQINPGVSEDKQSSPDEEEYFSCEETDNTDFDKYTKVLTNQPIAANIASCDDCYSITSAEKLKNDESSKDFSENCNASSSSFSCEKMCDHETNDISPRICSAFNLAISVHLDSNISSSVNSLHMDNSAETCQKSVEGTHILKRFGEMERKIDYLSKRLDNSNCKNQHAEVSESLTCKYPTIELASVNNTGYISSLTTDIQSSSAIEDSVLSKSFAITNNAMKKTCSYQNSPFPLNDMSKKEKVDDSSQNCGHHSDHFVTEDHRSRLTNVLPSTGAISKIQQHSDRARGVNNSFSDEDVPSDTNRKSYKSHYGRNSRKVNQDGKNQTQKVIPQDLSVFLPSTSTGTEGGTKIEQDYSKDIELTSIKNLAGFRKNGKTGLRIEDPPNVRTKESSKKWFNNFSFKKFKFPGHAVQIQNEASRFADMSNTTNSSDTIDEICANLVWRLEKDRQKLNDDLPHYPTEVQAIEVHHNSKMPSASHIMKKVFHFFKNKKPCIEPGILNVEYASAEIYDDEFFEIEEDSDNYFQYTGSEEPKPDTHDIAIQSDSLDCRNDAEINLCKGCSTAVADALYFPCGHNYLCVECATTVLKFFKICCICRKKIDSIQRLNI